MSEAQDVALALLSAAIVLLGRVAWHVNGRLARLEAFQERSMGLPADDAPTNCGRKEADLWPP